MERARDREKQVGAFGIYRSHNHAVLIYASVPQMFPLADCDVFKMYFRRPRGLSPNVRIFFPAVFGFCLVFSCVHL